MAEEKELKGAGANVTAIAQAQRPSLVAAMASRFDLEPQKFIAALRDMIFPTGRDGRQATDNEILAFLAIAHEHGMNPFAGEIYPYIAKDGRIRTIISVDGWLRKINEHPQFDGMEFSEVNDEKTGKPISVTITIHRKDRKIPTVVPERYDECYRPAFSRDGTPDQTAPWNQMPHRMLRHKAVRQGARYAFGFASVFDEDYYNEIPVGGSVTEAAANDIANKTNAKTQALKEKVEQKKLSVIKSETEPAQKTKAQKSADAPVVHPSEATQTQGEAKAQTEPPPAPKPEPTPPPPAPPPAAASGPDPEQVISEQDWDALIRAMLTKEGFRKDEIRAEAQDAMREELKRYGYTKTKEIKNKDYRAILEWAKDWTPGF